MGSTKDWVGNSKTTYAILGASNHSDTERQINDYYATDPVAVHCLLSNEQFSDTIWEPACGEGHISEALIAHGYSVISTDLIYRGYGNAESVDFLSGNIQKFSGDIITNPPYKYAQEFVEKAIDIIQDGHKVAMFLKLTFLEGKARRMLFKKYPPKTVYVFSSRVNCAKNGRFEENSSSAVAYAWFVWEKGFTGEPVIRWIDK